MGKTGASAEKKEVPAGHPASSSQQAAPKLQLVGKRHHEPAAGMCAGVGCKASAKRMGFCDEHYEQFKFGLINKFGEPVPDYEKKWEHYQAYLARMQGSRKAA